MFVFAFVLAGAGCGDDRPRPPRDAAQACLAAIDAALEDPAAVVVPASLSCRHLYRDRACGDAWAALAAPLDPAELVVQLQDVRDICRRACLRLSGGAPPRSCVVAPELTRPGVRMLRDVLAEVIAIDDGLHRQAGLSADEAARLSNRVALLAAAVPPPAAARPLIPDDPPGALVVHLSATEWKIAGIALDEARLRVVLADHAGSSDDPLTIIEAAADVEYARVSDLIQIAKDAGLTDIAFKVHRPGLQTWP